MYKVKWYLDSRCSRHMTGKANLFTHLEMKKVGKVTFGIRLQPLVKLVRKTTYIEDVLLVDGLKHNLLNVSQLCDKGNRVTFE